MDGDRREPPKPADDKARRLAERLRENLQRRKTAAGRTPKPKPIKNPEKF
ncbi:MAG: hypothetical protein ACMVY4_19440 [Minwuia sp.]